MKGKSISSKAIEKDEDVYMMPGWFYLICLHIYMCRVQCCSFLTREIMLLKNAAGMYHGLSNQRMCIANAIATSIKNQWRLVLPDLRFNYPEVNILFTEPFEFFFDVSALQSLSSYG